MRGYMAKRRETLTFLLEDAINDPDDRIKVQNVGMRNLQITESEEEVLAQMAVFFFDCGIPDHFDQDAFNSLFEKITEPSPFDYS